MSAPPKGKLAALFFVAGTLFWFFGPVSQQGVLPGPYDGPVRLLVLGDDQLLRDDGQPGWPVVARNVLKDEVGRHVELIVDSTGTAQELAAYLRGLSDPLPHLIVASLGWEDGAPGEAINGPELQGRVAQLAGRSVYEGGGFFVRTSEATRTAPVEFLKQLGEAKRLAAEKGVPLVFIEQTARVIDGPVDIAPTAAARPGPWLPIGSKLQEQSRSQWWSEEAPHRLTDVGHRRLGGVIGEQLGKQLRPAP